MNFTQASAQKLSIFDSMAEARNKAEQMAASFPGNEIVILISDSSYRSDSMVRTLHHKKL